MSKTCELCESIKTSTRGANGHDALHELESKIVSPIGQKKITITKYKCEKCETIWQYEDDKNDKFSGWTKLI